MVRIFVITDAVILRANIERALAQHPHYSYIGFAITLEQALEHIQLDPPEVIFIDLDLQNTNPISTLIAIRKRFPRILVITASAAIDEHSMGPRAAAAGADVFLPKPFTLNELFVAVEDSQHQRNDDTPRNVSNTLVNEVDPLLIHAEPPTPQTPPHFLSKHDQLPLDIPVTPKSTGSKDVETIGTYFREHHIDIRSMPVALRSFTGLAIAQLLAALLILTLNSRNWPQITLFHMYSVTLSSPELVLGATIIFIAIAWTFLIAGCLHAHPLVRPLGFFLYIAVLWNSRSVLADHSPWSSGVLGCIFLLGIVVVGTIMFDAQRKRRTGVPYVGHQERLQPATILMIFLLVLGVNVCAWLGRNPLPLAFGTAFNVELTTLAILLVPILLLAGIDLTEVGFLTGDNLSRLAEPLGGRVSTWIAAGVLAVIVGIMTFTWTVPYVTDAIHNSSRAEVEIRIGIGLGICIILGLSIWVVGKTHLPLAPEVPYGVLAGLVCLSYFALILVLFLTPNPHHLSTIGESMQKSTATVSSTPAFSGASPLMSVTQNDEFGEYQDSVGPLYRLYYPAGWIVNTVGSSETFSGRLGRGVGTFTVLPTPARQSALSIPNSMATLASEEHLSTPHITATSPDGVWETAQFTFAGGRDHGELWMRTLGRHEWILAGWSSSTVDASQSLVFGAMTDSWEVGSDIGTQTPTGPIFVTDVTFAILANVPVIHEIAALALARLIELAVLGLCTIGLSVVAYRNRSTKRGRMFSTSALFALVVTAIAVTSQQSSISLDAFVANYRGLFGNLSGLAQRPLPGILIAFSFFSGVWLISMILRRRVVSQYRPLLTIVASTNLGLLAVFLIFNLFDSIQYGGISLPSAIIILLAMFWDIIMSGKAITNGHSSFAPRHARVLLYFAYIVATSTLLLFYSTLYDQATRQLLASFFDSDFWPQQGVVDFGLPFVLVIFVIRVTKWRKEMATQLPPPSALDRYVPITSRIR